MVIAAAQYPFLVIGNVCDMSIPSMPAFGEELQIRGTNKWTKQGPGCLR